MKRLVLILILPILFTLVNVGYLLSSYAATLDQIRLSWQHDPKTTMTVMWRTQENQTSPRVQYGTTADYGTESAGTTSAAVLDSYFYHTVELTGLTPNTAYHYRVSGESGIWGADNIFRTAPDGSANFSFTAFGDNGTGAEGGRVPNQMKDLVASQNPAFHLLIGDLTYADGDRCNGRPCQKERWEEWFKEIERFSKTIPMMAAIGNHEIKSDVKFSSGETFYTRSLALPPQNSELYYSFDYGDVHFIALDSNNYQALRRGSAQYEWLRQDLAATTKRFRVVFFHHLAYTSGGEHKDTEAIQQETTPLFDQYDVDLVINGHNHHYERTYPLRYGARDAPVITSTNRTDYTGADGVVYVITGGGGRGIYNFGSAQPAWSAVRCECHEIVRVDVDDAGALLVRTIKIDGTEIDRFTISKTSSQSIVHSSQPPAQLATQPQLINLPTTSYVLPTEQTIRGFNFAVWSRDALGRSDALKSLDDLKAAGANYVAFAPFWYQDNKNSTQIYRRNSKTATDDSVRAAIRYTKSKGLKVALKPMVDSRDNTWRGQFEPSDPDAWFQSYRDFILTFAQIAKDEGVDYLIMGTEFTTLSVPQYSQKWRDLIRDIRAIYSGPVTYAANWGKRTDGEYYKIDWWDALDAIGIDAYFPVATDGNPTTDTVQSAWTYINSGGEQNWFTDIRTLHVRFNKPVIFTEIGFLSCDRAGIKPWEYPCSKGVDLEEQATLYEGTLRFWKEVEWMQGFLFWRWDVDPSKGGALDGDYLVQNKPPVLDVLKRFWSVAAPVPSPQSSPGVGEEANRVPSSPSGRGQGEGTPITSTSLSPSATGSSGGGGISTTISATPQSTLPTTSYLLPTRLFAYGKPRLPLWQERVRVWPELAAPLRAHFKGAIPLSQKHWPYYVNAYLYGNYPVAAIARSIELHGKTVHPTIPWSAWRKSPDYQKYIEPK